MAQALDLLALLIVRCFCVVQKQKGVADAMIEASSSVYCLHECMSSSGHEHLLKVTHSLSPFLTFSLHMPLQLTPSQNERKTDAPLSS